MQQENRWGEENSVYQALLSIYTGVFWIDLKNDSYKIIHSPKTIVTMLKGIESAQQAINYAIQKTVFSEEILDMKRQGVFVHSTVKMPKPLDIQKMLSVITKNIMN